MYAGAARVCITPPLPVQLAGYGVVRYGVEVFDDLYARALVCEADGRRAALVSCDLLWLERRNVARLRELIEPFGIAPDDCLIACTHTHSGPDTIDWYDHAPVDPAWLETLLHQIAGAVGQAARRLKPVTAERLVGEVRIGLNRRARVDDQVRLSPNPAGPVDHTLTVLRLTGEAGLVASVVCQQTHPVVLGGASLGVSADWPGETCRLVESNLGGVCLYVNGAAGDINPAVGCGRSYADALRTGRQAGGAAIELLCRQAGEAGDGVAGARQDLTVPDKPHPYLHTPLGRRLAADGGLRIEVQALRLGPLSFLSAPGECLTETGAAILAGTRLEAAVIAGFGNDYIGYLPLQHVWDQGGYEPSATMTTVEGVNAYVAASIAVGDALA